MLRTSKDILEANEIITESGRVFRPVHDDILNKLPPDIVKEMAKRRLEEIEMEESKKNLWKGDTKN